MNVIPKDISIKIKFVHPKFLHLRTKYKGRNDFLHLFTTTRRKSNTAFIKGNIGETLFHALALNLTLARNLTLVLTRFDRVRLGKPKARREARQALVNINP